MTKVKLVHFSDVLCVWAHVGQASFQKLMENFGEKIEVEAHYCSVFPDTQTKIKNLWKDRGGFEGYAAHVQDVAEQFDGFKVHSDVWRKIQPRSSASPHLFLKAIESLEGPDAQQTSYSDRPSAKAARALRQAFFGEAQDIANWNVQKTICQDIGQDFDRVLHKIETGEAIANLAADYDLAQSMHVQGSPTYVLNEGRQKLFGNVAYSILSANVKELLSTDFGENATECS
ncbi:Predicted dithiol-disulfide isomerase, DsbA family [Shimia gijangensis]|uniref:Predicted dithiol-disulfide isomerase, DsbA family n=1 Tax=Shimia gijangensis TaxID=1470563 RepID=A0A1M6HQU8_9RHOB|nr:DsbA family protein [Shimia gijangensis]SHJ24585.1 Predicted dithiol-disulfide isomerase, DsbA family [Shimia gijangensis]